MYLIETTRNSLAAVLHMNKSNAAGNSKRLYTPALSPDHQFSQRITYVGH